jgi:hypothetical protein
VKATSHRSRPAPIHLTPLPFPPTYAGLRGPLGPRGVSRPAVPLRLRHGPVGSGNAGTEEGAILKPEQCEPDAFEGAAPP